METHGNTAGEIAGKLPTALLLENVTTILNALQLTENTTKSAPFLMLFRMRSFMPTFPLQVKDSWRSLGTMWGKSKKNLTIASLPDMGDDEEWDEEEEIYK